jgi:hypothetical protein
MATEMTQMKLKQLNTATEMTQIQIKIMRLKLILQQI